MDTLAFISSKNNLLNTFELYLQDLEKSDFSESITSNTITKDQFINEIISLWVSISNINTFYNFIDTIKESWNTLYIYWADKVDWICSTVLFTEFLDLIDIDYSIFIPNSLTKSSSSNYNPLANLFELWLWQDNSNSSLIFIDNWFYDSLLYDNLNELWIDYYSILSDNFFSTSHNETKGILFNDINSKNIDINSTTSNEDDISTSFFLQIIISSYLKNNISNKELSDFMDYNSDLSILPTISNNLRVNWINWNLIKLYKDNFLETTNLRKSFSTIFWYALKNWKITYDQDFIKSNDIHKFISWTVWPIINSFSMISEPSIIYNFIKGWEWTFEQLNQVNNYRKQIFIEYRKRIELSSINDLKSKSAYFLYVFNNWDTFVPWLQSFLSEILLKSYNKIIWIWYDDWEHIRFAFSWPKGIKTINIFSSSSFNYIWNNKSWFININNDSLFTLEDFLSRNTQCNNYIECSTAPYELSSSLINMRTINILNYYSPFLVNSKAPQFIVKWILLKQKLWTSTKYITYTSSWYEKIKILVWSIKLTMYNFWWRITEDELFRCKSFVWSLEKPFNHYSFTPIFIINNMLYDKN